MNLTLVTRLNASGAALAETLSADHSVLVLHPDRWDLDGSFKHSLLEETSISEALKHSEAIIYYSENCELTALMLHMMEQTEGIAQLCLNERNICNSSSERTVEDCVCGTLQKNGNKGIVYVDIPAVYGDDFLPKEIEAALLKSRKNNVITFNGSETTLCDVIHVEDLASLINVYLDKQTSVQHMVVTGNYRIPLGLLAEKIKEEYKFVDILFCENEKKICEEMEREGVPEGWMSRHNIVEDIPGIMANLNERSDIIVKSSRKMLGHGIRRCLLFAGTFCCLWVYTNFIRVSSELQFVDVRLLFIIAMSLFLGRGYGLAAGVLCSISSVVDSLMLGYSWYTIFFHVDNWIPIAVYMASSVLFGMYHDNNRQLEED